MKRINLFLAALMATLISASAQVSVNIEVKRKSYIRYEPLIVTVSLTNMSGRDLLLEDGESPWFGFTVLQGAGNSVVPPRETEYRLDPLELKIGETVKRTVNLNQLFPISEYGLYRIRGTIYSKSANQYYTSRTANIEITEGRTVWKQMVGVPDTMKNAGNTHEVTLLAMQQAVRNVLYCRIIDPSSGNVLCMQKIGHLVDGSQFDAKFDATNTLYILQLAGPKTYTLTQIGVNGDVYGQWTYDAPKSKPYLRRDGTGNLDIIGATRREKVAATATPAPKLSDRPANLPKK